MKHILTLNLGVKLVCSDEFAEKLKNEGINIMDENLFPQLSKEITSFNIQTEEICDSSIGNEYILHGENVFLKNETKQESEVFI